MPSRFGSTNSLLVWFGLMTTIAIDTSRTAICPGEGNITDSRGTLQSPGYPKAYPKSTVCVWVITAPRGEYVRLLIKAIDLEYCVLCHCDYVEVREGASADGQLIGRFCNQKRTTVYSEGRQLWVKFRSDMAYQRKGFSASFSRIKLRKKEPIFLHANDTSGFIKSSNNPAVCGSGRQCTWVIFAHEGYNVQLALGLFEFPSCFGSYIEIRDGPRCSSQLIGTFCGDERPPPDLCSLGNSLYITFKYNSTRDLQMNRFELLYREVQCTKQAQKNLIFTEPVNSEHWRSMAVGIACTSFFLFVVLVGCFLKIASNHRFAGLERATSQIELNPFESSITEETTLCNDGEQLS
ncbi:dorsal-ventral patterning tolloid-like protein 1 [Orbicella faveolata]|uniref:dorsal-ventral patterning tolloid-like protein 1 n=1 Tax=Orbicella faveolata TaxID=48498 RepID=UPI0009E60E90|nr:dorsal-ventral patterning tolloid-like protein 1 [Orbicella faveolata]